jgi:acetyl-CoA carboxylase biotin carboxyl carrier protein
MRDAGAGLYRPPVGTSGARFRPSVETRSTSGQAPIFSRMADIEAHITGTVWKIECKIGDRVEEGDTVVILESMKMEMPVEAEDEGTVKEILCEEGQAVNEGDTLVVLE